MKKLLLIILSVGLLAGCSDNLPKCDDDAVKDEVANQLQYKGILVFSPDIRNAEERKQLTKIDGMYQCGADVSTTQGNIFVSYEITKNKSKKEKYIVNVLGYQRLN
ncbi:hypothetical protein [Lonepinella sp. MS14436]|uniref:hypothetical protein n=1 Tax=Lonepinella sp. MS14436 TaxID=3003619 RepID=UPI0036DC2CDF